MKLKLRRVSKTFTGPKTAFAAVDQIDLDVYCLLYTSDAADE